MNAKEENSPTLSDADATVLSEVTYQGNDDSLSLSSAGSSDQPKKVSQTVIAIALTRA